MTEQAPSHDSYDSVFTGKHVDIQLADHATLTTQLEARDHFQTFLNIKDQDRLPYPATLVSLESWYDKHPNAPRVEGTVTFHPTALELTSCKWPGGFLEELAKIVQAYGYQPAYQEHDTAAIYISLDRTHCVRMALSSTATECVIDVNLELTGEIENATHEPLPEPLADRELAPIEKFQHAVTLLGISIDQLREYYGDPPKHHGQHILRQYVPSKELVPVTAESESIQVHEFETDDVSMTGFDSIGGAVHAKQRLTELAAIANYPDEAADFDVSPSHFLLHGPPGTGKTSLVKAFCTEIGAEFLPVSSTDIVDSFVGKSGKNTVEAFNNAKQIEGKVVIFFDEFDALAQKIGNGAGERTDIKKNLNTQIEDIAKNHPNIIIAAATNADLDDLEPSLIRSGRLETISVPYPSEEERLDIFGVILLKSILRVQPKQILVQDGEDYQVSSVEFVLYDPSIDLTEIAKLTDGMTGADFEEILERARKRQFVHFRKTGEKHPVTQQDLMYEIQHFSR